MVFLVLEVLFFWLCGVCYVLELFFELSSYVKFINNFVVKFYCLFLILFRLIFLELLV